MGVDLLTPDLAAARDLYAPLLGWRLDPAGDDRVVVARTAAGGVAATLRAVEGASPTGWVVSFAGLHPGPVDGPVVAAGGVPAAGAARTRPGGVVCTDPGGALLAVVPAPGPGGAAAGEPPAPGPGSPVWFERMTSAPERADAFCAAVLGLVAAAAPGAPAAPPDAPPDAPPFVLLQAAGRPVAGRLQLPEDLAPLLGERWMVYFAVDDVDAAALEAARLGADVLVGPRDAPTGRVAALRDGAGAVVTLMRPRS